MKMTFEKINEPIAPIPDEHPAARAARMIKDLHLENIALMDRGHVFIQNGVNVNDTIRKQCLEQIAMCEHIIEHAPFMKPESLSISAELLAEVTETLKQAQDKAPVEMPEIGNYDHKK